MDQSTYGLRFNLASRNYQEEKAAKSKNSEGLYLRNLTICEIINRSRGVNMDHVKRLMSPENRGVDIEKTNTK